MKVRGRGLVLLLLLAAAAAGCKVAPVAGNAERAPGAAAPGADATARETTKYRPLGSAAGGPGPGTAAEDLGKEEVPVRDRWRIGFPSWDRGSASDSPFDHGRPLDPYHQNVLKGDYPLPGTQNTFLVLEASSRTLLEQRRVPTPSGVFPRGSGSAAFFGDGQQRALEEFLSFTADLFHGETAFKPVDWRFVVKGVANWNLARAEENTALFPDPSRGVERKDRHVALQQAFFETTLATVSDRYDVVQARIGTQPFNADFRGFLFVDEALGARLFGNLDDNLWQWNAGVFRRWDKDTNSGLNEFESIRQRVVVVNLYRQDVLRLLLPGRGGDSWSRGLTAQLSWNHFADEDSVAYDENGFLVRPNPVGTLAPSHRRVEYYGWNVDGHVGRVNVTSSLYAAFGHESFNPIAGKPTRIDARMAALELSLDRDWMRWKAFGFWQSGDPNPLDGTARGFDAIFDSPNFAGGEFGFWNRNAIRLTGTGVGLVQRGSLLNSLRSSKDEGQPSFVNPGLQLFGVGWDAQLTPRVKLVSNASYLLFDHTESLQRVLNQGAIGREIGYDLSVGTLWRPLLTENVVVKGGVSALVPGHGFRDVYTARTLYAAFVEVVLTW